MSAVTPKPAPSPSAAARDRKRAADDQRDMLARLNKSIAQVQVGDRLRYVELEREGVAFLSKADMADKLAHVEVLNEKGESISAFKWWLRQEKRHQLFGVIFEPDLAKARPDALNLYRGRPIEPEGEWKDWSLFDDHVKRNICAGNRKSYSYFLDWCAHLVQYPGVKIGVAVVLYGGVGCGKSVVSDILAECLGKEYCPVVDTPESLTGKHNNHLARAQLIRVEEALHAKDPRHDSRLKHTITGTRILIEPKGVDAFEIDSKSNLIFTTNKKHAVTAIANERRYFCLHVADNNQKDTAYFVAIKQQMRDGGYAAFLAHLLRRDISKRDFGNPPATALLSVQMIESMQGMEKWWHATLASGRLPFARDPELPEGDLGWPVPGGGDSSGAWTVPKDVVSASAADFGRDFAGAPTPEAVGRFLAANVPDLTQTRPRIRGDRLRCYNLPPLEVCREAFVKARPGLRLEDVSDAVPEVSEADDGTGEAAAAAAEVIPFRRTR